MNQSDPGYRWQLSWERPQKCPSPMVCPISRRPGQAQWHTSQKWQWGALTQAICRYWGSLQGVSTSTPLPSSPLGSWNLSLYTQRSQQTPASSLHDRALSIYPGSPKLLHCRPVGLGPDSTWRAQSPEVASTIPSITTNQISPWDSLISC